MDKKNNYTTHSFSVEMAKNIGLEETLILGHLYHWCLANSDNQDMIKKDNVWVFISKAKMLNIYPYLSEGKIKGVISRLENQGYILIDCFNKIAIDKTKWYALTDKSYSMFGTSISQLINKNQKSPTLDNLTNHKSESPTISQNDQAIQDIKINYNNKLKEDIDLSISKKNDSFNFKQELLKLGVSEDVATDWMKIRKKTANSERAFKRIKHEIELTGASANDCITLCADKGWLGFEAEWFFKIKGKSMSAYDVNKEKDNANKILINGVEYK